MDFNGVKEIIEEVNASNISYFEYKTNDGHIKMDKSLTRSIGSSSVNEENVKPVLNEVSKAESNSGSNQVKASEVSKNISEETIEDEDLNVIKAPMVGTFYRSASQDSAPYVTEGKPVKKGDVLCIIEAMKLMNEIESDFTGTVVKVLVKDGEMVEFGQPLFKIKED